MALRGARRASTPPSCPARQQDVADVSSPGKQKRGPSYMDASPLEPPTGKNLMSDSTRPRTGPSTPLSCPRFAAQWSEVLEQLRKSIGAEQFNIWFRAIRGVRMAESTLELELPNGQYVDWIRKRFFRQLEDVARRVLGPDVNIVLKASERLSECELPKPVSLLPPGASKPSERLVEPHGPYSPLFHRWVDKLLPEVGLSTWGVYLVLLRFVWRGPTHINVLQEHIGRGALVAHVSNGKLTRILGLSVRKVRYCLRELERVSLIRVIRCPGRASLYMLGHKGSKGECWFADLVCEEL